MKKVPETREDITLEWLNWVFQSQYNLNVICFEWSDPVGVGLGQLSSLERLTIFYTQESELNEEVTHGELNIIIKTVPLNEDIRKFTVMEGFIQREYNMYTKVFPAWNDFLESKKVPESYIYRYPTCYFGAEDGEGMDYRMVLILEDLSSSDFVQWAHGYKKGLGWEETKAIVKQLALFHATGMAYKEHKSITNYFEEFPFLYQQSKDKGLVTQLLATGARNILVRMEEEDAENMPIELIKDLNNLGKPEQIDRLPELTFPQKGTAGTITHHDLHVNNVMLRGSCDQDLQSVLLDFQVCTYSNPMKDLSFLLFLNCETSLFKAKLPQVLQYYHRIFKKAIAQMDVDVEYSLEQIREDFDSYSHISIIHILMGSESWLFGPNTSKDTIRRVTDALLDTFSKCGNKLRI